MHNWCRKGVTLIAASNEAILVVKFSIRGNLRFLSHAETVKLFQRACVRAGIRIRYSQGFNPRPRLSLPLPRSVGVESDDDLLCVKVETSAKWSDAKQFRSALSRRLPPGCELLTVKVAEAKTSFQPCAATYILAVHRENFNKELKSRIKRILASDGLNIRRQINARGDTRNVDVRPFLESIEFDSENIVVKCKITSAGSIRVEEILKLLGLGGENLAAPIKRTSVQWQSN